MSITKEHGCADKTLFTSNTLLQDNKHGHKEGKDPLFVEINLLKEAGHEDLPLAKVIRKKCLECCNFQLGEVRKCVATECPLWAYRMGKNPFTSAKRKSK